MFFTQFITPSPGMDPAQRRMMAFMMPVLFGFMLWHYASGLALYWGTSNILSLAMQIGINRSHWGKEMHAIADRRNAKKPPGGGSGPKPSKANGKAGKQGLRDSGLRDCGEKRWGNPSRIWSFGSDPSNSQPRSINSPQSSPNPNALA